MTVATVNGSDSVKSAVTVPYSVSLCPTTNPFESFVWNKRTAEVKDSIGNIVFRQENVEAPESWSDQAVNIAASKYFYGLLGSKDRETSIKQLIHRVVETICVWGLQDGYLNEITRPEFYRELVWMLLSQHGAFNSPVWFNLGLHQVYNVTSGSAKETFRYEKGFAYAHPVDPMVSPQCSACFIVGIDDSMQSITEANSSAARIFKYGSGFGADWSKLRGSMEPLSGGGKASGPLSFMKMVDTTGGTIKSGGRTRRAACMFTLKCDHPDVESFITVKPKEEAKARALIQAGYPADFNGEAYSTVGFQNANISLRVTDEFMEKAISRQDWQTKFVKDGRPGPTYPAHDLLRKVAEGVWSCGDPGIQFEDTIQLWHTTPKTAPINSSNPCSEYMSVDDSACNLASLNLLKFYDPRTREFNVESYRHCIRVFFTAQEILVGRSSYPTAKIAETAVKMRQLGLGYANLGALIMACGLPYDSDDARSLCGALTAIMTGHAYRTSALLAKEHGAFTEYDADSMLNVIGLHRTAAIKAVRDLPVAGVTQLRGGPTRILSRLWDDATYDWDEAYELGQKHGYRNAQATVLAPTGTIAFLMDCDTTGIEPELGLVKYKSLAGGGMMKIVNQTVGKGLRSMGYSEDAIKERVAYIEEHGRLEGFAEDEGTLAVFDTSLAPSGGKRSIRWQAHVDMMAAAQPFVSGAISKTVNMPEESTVDDIYQAYVDAWKKGLKAIAIYRDGSKSSQPLSTTKGGNDRDAKISIWGSRKKMPNERQAVIHKFVIDGHEGYLTVGLHEDGTPGEVFIKMAKEGSTVSGLMDVIGVLISFGLQYGVPLDLLVAKLSYTHFEPHGFTKNPKIPTAKSIVDYVFRFMGLKFLEAPVIETPGKALIKPSNGNGKEKKSSGPPCQFCGSITVRAGSCYACHNCGNTSGCG